MNWSLLGIQPTKDKKAITAAYRSQLTSVNPEDKPEEFKALREAYEEALRLAAETEAKDEAPKDNSPVGLWMERVRALYESYPERIRPENWKELLADPVCVALDTRPLAEEALLHFFMELFDLPQAVWQTLDETFSWSERRRELYEHYPRDFVDYAVLNGIRYPDNLAYGLFEPGIHTADCDQYRHLYYKAIRAADEDLEGILRQMDALSERHPYGDALRFQYAIRKGQEEEGREGLRRLAEAYPDDVLLVTSWLSQCVLCQSWEEGEALARHVLELSPGHFRAKRMLADCLAGQNRQKEAKDLIFELCHAAGGDRKQVYQLQQVIREWNQDLILRWEPYVKEHPEDLETTMELGWCYLQSDRAQEALTICKNIPDDYEDRYNYHNLYAKSCFSCLDFEGAYEHLEQLIRLLTSAAEGKTEPPKRLNRLPEMIQMAGSCLYLLGRPEEARASYQRSLELAPENPELLTQMAQMLCSQEDFAYAVQILEKLTEVMPGSYHGHFLLAQALYELNRDRDAFDEVNRALELDGSDLGVYILKMRILLRNGVWDGVHQVIDFLHENGITDDLSVQWCEAQLAEFEEKDSDKALERYQAIAKRLEGGDQLPWASQVYFRITVLLSRKLDTRKKEDRAQLLAVLDKGLAQRDTDPDCMDFKAWLLKRDDQTEEALKLYHQLEAQPRHGLNVEQELAELYYKDLEHHADKALHYYQILLDNEETPELHFYAGYCCRYLSDHKAAEQHFLREKELDPEDVDAYRGLGFVYEALGQYEDALENAEKAIEIRQRADGNHASYYIRKMQILRRLRRPEDAVQAVDYAKKKYGYDYEERMKFQIYCQFGLWDEAKEYLEQWKKKNIKQKELYGAQLKLEMLLGHYTHVRAALLTGKKKLNTDDYRYLRLSMDQLDGNVSGQLRDWEERRGDSGEHTDYALMNLAQLYWWKGEQEQAQQYAKQAMEKEEEQLRLFIRDEALYRGRRCLMLAILGREEEARAELARTRAMPLCEHCDYGSCKDADIYEANMEEIFGHYQRAMELYRAGQKNWPDDIDFASGIRRLERKGF